MSFIQPCIIKLKIEGQRICKSGFTERYKTCICRMNFILSLNILVFVLNILYSKELSLYLCLLADMKINYWRFLTNRTVWVIDREFRRFFIWWSDNLEMEYLSGIPIYHTFCWSKLGRLEQSYGYMQLYIILIFKRVWYQWSLLNIDLCVGTDGVYCLKPTMIIII